MRKRTLSPIAPVFVYPLPKRYRRIEDRLEGRRRLSSIALWVKRSFDVVASSALLLLTSPIFLIVSLWIPIDSPGPPFFTHKRVGLHGRRFRMYKFRTMRLRAHAGRRKLLTDDSDRLFFKKKQDPRITRFGRFLRKYSLDELPQLINVLRGDMSLIGPRPLLRDNFANREVRDPLYRRWVRERHLLWPGLTGLWQVAGRNDLSPEESMRLDLHYISQWNIRLEILILVRTVPAILAGRGAY